MKGNISWTRRTDAGERIEVDARRSPAGWVFRWREGRSEQWRPLEKPPLEDCLELLSAVSRRVGRHLMRPEEVERLRAEIRSRFPDVDIED